jgi:hypothetical protein
MAEVMVYRFTVYDGWNDEIRLSSRWATHAAIENIKVGIILEHTGTLIDETHIDADGMTERGFMPDDEKSMRSSDNTFDFRQQGIARLDPTRGV